VCCEMQFGSKEFPKETVLCSSHHVCNSHRIVCSTVFGQEGLAHQKTESIGIDCDPIRVAPKARTLSISATKVLKRAATCRHLDPIVVATVPGNRSTPRTTDHGSAKTRSHYDPVLCSESPCAAPSQPAANCPCPTDGSRINSVIFPEIPSRNAAFHAEAQSSTYRCCCFGTGNLARL